MSAAEEEIVVDDEVSFWESYNTVLPRWLILVIAAFGVVGMVPLLSRVKRSGGKEIKAHILFVIIAAVLLSPLVPEEFQDIVFSEGGVLVVGTLLPVYESIVAVCTFGEQDDNEWLTFWIVNGFFTYSTEFMDTIADHSQFVADHWYELEFFIALWLLLPWTDGCTVIYDHLLVKFVLPILSKFQPYLESGSKVQLLVLTLVNSGYLGLVWSIFVMMPEGIKRFAVIGVGTVYPILSSVMALAATHDIKTKKKKENKVINQHAVTYWLTYWSCFSVLFVSMDYLETFVGRIPGFYSLILVSTVYLFLPMFQGADVVFRRVLVPLTGQYEAMLLRDTLLLKQQMEYNIPNKHMLSNIKTKAAQMFLTTTSTTTNTPSESKTE